MIWGFLVIAALGVLELAAIATHLANLVKAADEKLRRRHE